MIALDDLTGIPKKKRKQAIECLDDLLTFRDEQGRLSTVITGYNWYITLSKSDSIVTFSNIHETEAYKSAMLRDLAGLGYEPQIILGYIREKTGVFLWNPKFRIRRDDRTVLPGLKIKDMERKEYLDLTKFTEPLIRYPEFAHLKGCLIGENQGWELGMPFKNKGELMILVNLFLRKSGLNLYNEKGEVIEETDEEKLKRAPWTDAYETPVLLLGETALRYANELPHFVPATKIALKENSNEISFVIHKNLEQLRKLLHYEQLLHLGFSEELCLGNKPFLKYIDKIR